jgi:hypothetical protein
LSVGLPKIPCRIAIRFVIDPSKLVLVLRRCPKTLILSRKFEKQELILIWSWHHKRRFGVPKKKAQRERGFLASEEVLDSAKDYFQLFWGNRPKGSRRKGRVCYVQTALGVLEVRVELLLFFVAKALALSAGKKLDDPVYVNDDTVETAIAIMDRIPDYLAGDLVGLIKEYQFEKGMDLLDGPFRWKHILKALHSSSEALLGVKVETLRILLENFGITALEIPDVRHAFQRICANRGVIGSQWKRFLSQNFKKKRRPGRPRNEQYDALLQKRFDGSQAISYGQLARELSDAIPKEKRVNWLKSAASYRRRRLRGAPWLQKP